MLVHNETGSGKATAWMPQGQLPRADPLPPPSPSEATNAVSQDRPHRASLGYICGQLMRLEGERRFAISQQIKGNNATEAQIARIIGYRVFKADGVTKVDEAERKRFFKKAKAIREAFEEELRGGREKKTSKPKTLPPEAELGRDEILEYVQPNMIARSAWDAMRAAKETQMLGLAPLLPAYEWIQGVLGITEKGLAVIVGEAGNLSDYPDDDRGRKPHRVRRASHYGPPALWKRLGLAVMSDSFRQGRVPPGLSREDRKKAWKERSYNPRRRAEMFAFVDDMLLRAQYRAPKDENGKDPRKTGKPVVSPERALGPYGEHYMRKRSDYEASGHPVPGIAARRYMTKMFIRDLWRAWRKAVVHAQPLEEAAE